MTATTTAPAPEAGGSDRYKWTALSNTTLGVFMASLDSSIVLISLPAIFRGIHLDPLQPSNISYLLWMLMGYLVVTAVLVVTFGRLGDMYGRVRMYNAGFAVFSVASLALSLCPCPGSQGAMWLIAWRVVQGVGGALLMANSAAILTDAFKANQRGFAIGVSVIAGLVLVLIGLTYGLLPHHGASMGWTGPWVLLELVGGAALLVVFCVIETRVEDPMFNLQAFKIRAFAAGNIAGLLAAVGRGGLQFVLIIWLQGIWLPLHGYSFERTPLWAGIYMLPLTGGFLLAGPVCGWLSDRWGARWFTTGGMLIAAASFGLLMTLPTNFGFPVFGALLLLNGIGTGMFSAPNMTGIMNSAPPEQRGAASGMRATFQKTGMVLSFGVLLADDRRPLGVAPRPHGHAGRGQRGARGDRRARRPPPRSREPLRGLPRVQPDAEAARRAGRARWPERPVPAPQGEGRAPHRQGVLPPPDLRAVQARPGHRVLGRDGDVPDRGRRVVDAGREVRARAAFR